MIDVWHRMKKGSFYIDDGLTGDQLPISFEQAAATADEHVLRDAFEKKINGEEDPGEYFIDRIDEIIESAEVSEEQNTPAFWEADGFWDDCPDDDFPEDTTAYPYVEFTFTATDARYVAHMIPGTHWATAQYCD
ncbi:hypothetical protein [Saccharopolyspora sp. NPDC002376]